MLHFAADSNHPADRKSRCSIHQHHSFPLIVRLLVRLLVVRLLVGGLVGRPVGRLIGSFMRSFVLSLAHSCVCWCVRSFVRWFVGPCMVWRNGLIQPGCTSPRCVRHRLDSRAHLQPEPDAPRCCQPLDNGRRGGQWRQQRRHHVASVIRGGTAPGGESHETVGIHWVAVGRVGRSRW